MKWLSHASKKFDGVFIGGDITSWGDLQFTNRLLKAVGDEWKRIFFVPGNHDPRETAGVGSVNLHGQAVKIGRYSVGGLVGSNVTPFGTPFEMPDDEANSILRGLGKVDLLISHCPPFGTNCDLTEGGDHVGSKPVREFIQRESPRLVLCTIPSTVILGDNKPISELQTGGHTIGLHGENTIKEVVSRKYSGMLVTVRGGGLLPFFITPEHPLLVVRKRGTTRGRKPLKENVNLFSGPQWKTAVDLKPVTAKDTNGDYLILPRLHGTIETSRLPLIEYAKSKSRISYFQKRGKIEFPLNQQTAWLLGLYVAEGHTGKSQVLFSLHRNEVELQKRLGKVARTLGYRSEVYRDSDENGVSVIVYSSLLARALPVWCGHLAHNKNIPEFILFNKDSLILLAFLNGYRADDGCVTAHSTTAEMNTTSEVLALQLQLAFARLGVVVTILTEEAGEGTIQGRPVSFRTKFKVRYSKSPKWTKSYVTEDKILVPLRRIRTISYNGEVSNLSTTDETYLISNIVTHNCGHIHEARAVDTLNGSKVVNPGALLNGNFAVVQINNELDAQPNRGEFS
jgi:Icc-related predicted phosphoesterase